MVEGAGFSISELPSSYLNISGAMSRPFRLDGSSNVDGKDLAVTNAGSSSQIFASPSGEFQRTGERKWALARLFGQMDALPLGGSDLLGTLAADSILPRHNFDMQLGGGISPGSIQGMFAQAKTPGMRIVPYLALAERYDSNVFFAPALPGLKRQDYVTSFSPGILFLDNSHLVRTTFQVGAIGEYFAINPGLNYVGVNGVLTLSMNELVRRVVPGATFLVAQSVNYSPVVPGFQGGVDSSAAQSTPDDEQPDVTTTLVRSQQLYRVNSLSTNSTVAGSAPLTSSVQFQAAYGYSRFQFGAPSVNAATGTNSAQTISSTAHSVQAGPSWRITSSDTLGLRAIFEKADYGGGQGGYQALGGSLGWQRRISQNFNVRLYAGATSVDQTFGSSLGQQAGSTKGIGYTGGASAVYVSGPQTVQFTYTSGIAPSFVSAVGSMQTNIVQLIAFRRLEYALSISGGMTYNHSAAMNGNISTPGTFFESYSGYAGVAYNFSPKALASLSYSAGTYHGNYFTSEVQSFGRNAITFSISAYW
jgi:hypothetical protein